MSNTVKPKPVFPPRHHPYRHVIRNEWFREFTWKERFQILCGFNLLVYTRIPCLHNPGEFQPIMGAMATKQSTADNHLIDLLEKAVADAGTSETFPPTPNPKANQPEQHLTGFS